MHIVSFNLNGIRSALKKGLAEWVQGQQADVYCFQEIKADPAVMASLKDAFDGYDLHSFSAQKKGYSGTGLLIKKSLTPDLLATGCGHELYDHEGRMMRADFGRLTVLNAYFPSGTSGDERQTIKEQFLAFYLPYVEDLRAQGRSLLLTGDFNICHQEIDIHDPVGNKKSSGFLPHERQWMTDLLAHGYVDSYRHLHPTTAKYTWWSNRAGVRERNKGWRIDYHVITPDLLPTLQGHDIHNEAVFSDHCPLSVHLVLV